MGCPVATEGADVGVEVGASEAGATDGAALDGAAVGTREGDVEASVGEAEGANEAWGQPCSTGQMKPSSMPGTSRLRSRHWNSAA